MYKKAVLASVGGLTVLVLGLFLGLKLTSQPQRLENKAAYAGGAATFKLEPQNTSLNVGQTTTVSAKLNTGNSQMTIYQAVIYFTYSEASPPVELLGSTVIPAEPGLNCITNSISHDTSAKRYTMVVSCSVPLTYPIIPYSTNNTDKNMFTFNIRGVSTGTLSYDFDDSDSKVNTNDANASDILDIPLNGSYVVGAGSAPTNTPTPTSSQNPGPSATPTPTNVPSGNGATNSCGGTCGSNNNCNAGLVCSSGFCRNPSCTGEASCNCPGATATPRPLSTPRPTAIVPTPTPTPNVITYNEPTIVSDNPFLGGTPRDNVEVPDINYEPTVQVEKTNWFVLMLRNIVAFLRSLFGFR